MQQASITPIHLHTNRVLPGHGTGINDQASNDENFERQPPVFKMVLAVLGNMLGGLVLLSGLFALPYLIGFVLS